MADNPPRVLCSLELDEKPEIVYSFFKHLEEIPKYAPNIRQIDVKFNNENGLERSISKWSATLSDDTGRVPISWVEEDIYKFNPRDSSYCISFSLNPAARSQFKQEDEVCPFSTFQGEWAIKKRNKGSIVQLTLDYAIHGCDEKIRKDFGNFLNKLIGNNLLGILNGIKKRFPGKNSEPEIHLPKFDNEYEDMSFDAVLLGHPINAEHIEDTFRRRYEVNDSSDSGSMSKFSSQLFPSYISTAFDNIGKSGLRIAYVTCPFLPRAEPSSSDLRIMKRRIEEAFEIAAEHKNIETILALGGFTSIVASKMTQFKKKHRSKRVFSTAGSYLTAASILESIQESADFLGYNPSKSEITVLGASGSIGTKCVPRLAKLFNKINLTARNKSKLEVFVEEAQIKNAVIFPADKNADAVKDSQFVVTITSNPENIISASDCNIGTVICDAGYPKNVFNGSNIKDRYIYPGGLVETPWDFDFESAGIYTELPKELRNKGLYGCWAEGIVLALENNLDFEAEMKQLPIEKGIEKILNMAKKHGILPANIRNFLH